MKRWWTGMFMPLDPGGHWLDSHACIFFSVYNAYEISARIKTCSIRRLTCPCFFVLRIYIPNKISGCIKFTIMQKRGRHGSSLLPERVGSTNRPIGLSTVEVQSLSILSLEILNSNFHLIFLGGNCVIFFTDRKSISYSKIRKQNKKKSKNLKFFGNKHWCVFHTCENFHDGMTFVKV